MIPKEFKAMLVEEGEGARFVRSIVKRKTEELPDNEVLVKVEFSSLNYKDALSASGNKGVTRNFPHTPGIDAVGTVVSSRIDDFTAGDAVIVTSYDLGMNTAGGFGEYIRVPAAWLVPLPANLNMRDAMIQGTAGFTAALSVNELVQGGVKPEDGEVLVTGATGGVGSVAVQILAKLGYQVVAATGKAEAEPMLRSMGAKELIGRDETNDDSGRPMLRERWAGVIDTVGGGILATAIKTTQYGGVVTCCGNVADHTFTSSVYPFILRGIKLCGIDSANCPMEKRRKLWNLLAGEWQLKFDENYVSEVNLEGLEEKIVAILNGQLAGRTVVNLSAQ